MHGQTCELPRPCPHMLTCSGVFGDAECGLRCGSRLLPALPSEATPRRHTLCLDSYVNVDGTKDTSWSDCHVLQCLPPASSTRAVDLASQSKTLSHPTNYQIRHRATLNSTSAPYTPFNSRAFTLRIHTHTHTHTHGNGIRRVLVYYVIVIFVLITRKDQAFPSF